MRRVLPVALLLLAVAPASRARQVEPRPVAADTLLRDTRPSSPGDTLRPPGPSPRGALWRAAAVPGWGHVYTKRYGRLPFVYGALGGLAVAAAYTHGSYVDYRRAYRYKAWQELVDRGQQPENPWADLEGAYDEVAARIGPVSAAVLKRQRDTHRRNRDLAILATGVAWALSVLDAYVGAHLLDFDVSDDLSVRVIPDPASGYPAAALAWRPGTTR